MAGRFPGLFVAMALVVAVPVAWCQDAPAVPAAPVLSTAHQSLQRILTHYRNTPYTHDAAFFVYEVYLEANHLLPRYKVVLDEQLRSGEVAQAVVPSGPFLPGDIHTFRPPRAPAGVEPLFGLHLLGDRFLIVDEARKVVVEASISSAPWKDWLLSTRRVFPADHAAYVAPVFVDGAPVAVAQAAVVTAPADGDDTLLNLLAAAAAMVCALFILQFTKGKQVPRERAISAALPQTSPLANSAAPQASPLPPPPSSPLAPVPKPPSPPPADEDDLVIRRIRGPEEKN